MQTQADQHETLSVNGIKLFFRTKGEGEPLLLLHGGMGSGEDWEHFGWDWLKGFRCIVPDLRGHGRTSNDAPKWLHRQNASDMFELLDSLGIEKFKAIGISGGGNILLHMATAQPERVKSMILVSATSYFPEQTRVIMRGINFESKTEEELNVLRRRHPGGETQIRKLVQLGNDFSYDYTDMNFTPPYLSTIQARTLIVQGDRDPFYPVEISFEMHKAIPKSALWIVPNGGHGPVFEDMKDVFLRTSRTFLVG